MTAKKILRRIARWVANRQSYSVALATSMSGLPANLEGKIILVGAVGAFKWAVFQCPCGCGERIDVNLMRSHRPSWHLRLTRDKVTLYPSIWVPSERCGSHFWIVRNQVRWFSKGSRERV